MDFIEIKDPEIDVEKIMTEIKAKVAKRLKEDPKYAADVERFEKEQRKYLVSDESLSDAEFLENNYDIDQARPIFSHRPFVGKIIIGFKKLLYYLVHDVFSLTLQNQVIFNFFTAKSYKNLLEKVESLENKVKSLENLVNSLKGKEKS